MNHNSLTTHPVKRWWALALLIFLFGSMRTYAQTPLGACANAPANVAWFGIDADLYANTPSSGTLVNTDDWFQDAAYPGAGIGVISTGLGESFTSSGEPLIGPFTAAGFRNYLINATSVNARNVRFEERMAPARYLAVPRSATEVVVYLDAVAGRDNFSTSSTNDSSKFDGVSNKNGDNPNTWSLGIGNVPQKNDIVDAGGHIRYLVDPTTGDRKLFGFAFATRLETNGDNHVDFEILRQSNLQFISPGNPVVGNNLTGGHAVGYVDATGNTINAGDVLIAIDYENGGTNPTYSVRVWVKPDSLGVGVTSFAQFNALPNIPFRYTGTFDSGNDAFGYGYAEIEPLNPATGGQCFIYAQTNALTTTPGTPWGNIINPGANFTPDLQGLQLISCAINFDAFGLDATQGGAQADCENFFGNLLVKTRSSSSFTAELKDYAGPYRFGDFSTLNVTASGGTVTCDNTTATLTATITGVNPAAATINWTGPGAILSGQGTASATASVPGTYTATVQDLGYSNCIRTATAVIVDGRTPATVTCPSTVSLDCNNPSQQVCASNYSGCTITWYAPDGSSLGSSACITLNQSSLSGSYKIVARNTTSGCKDSCTFVVNKDFGVPTVSCSPDRNITCATTSATLSATATASAGNSLSYLWSTGATGSSISVTDGDTYSVTVTQTNGCTASSSCSAVVDTCKPTVAPTNNGPITCTNRTRTVSANAVACTGKTISNYAWTPSGSGASFSTGDAGTYTVVVTQSGNGCTATGSTTLAVDTCKPTVSPDNNGPITCTNPTRTVNANAAACTGKAIASYSWSPAGSGASFTTGDAGTYTVTVTQTVNGCTATGSTTLAVDTCKPTVSPSNNGPITCTNPTRTVSANAVACTGKTITNYAWTPSGSGASFTTGDAGTYTVVVTQSGNGCTATGSTTLAVDTCKPTVAPSNDGPITCTNRTRTVSANATACTGKAIASYSWSPSGSGASFTTGDAGTYTVTVTQTVNGCTATGSTTLAVDTCKPTVTPNNNGPITCTDPTRTINANAVACTGKTITNYAWSPSGSGASFTTGIAGTYTVTVTQSGNGCTATGSTTLGTNNSNPTVQCTPGADITCTRLTSTITATATASAGNTITSYAWTPGGATTSSITVNNGDSYSVVVTQSNGCTATCSSAVAVDTCKPTVSPSNNGPITCTNRTRTVSANATACTGKTITNYAWTPSGSGASFTTGDAATYCVTVTQSVNGCTATGCTTLAVDTCKPTVTASNNGPITCTNRTRTVSASAQACAGKSIASYSWSPGGSTSASFTTGNADTYCVTVVQSGNGCTATDCTDLLVDTCKPSVTASNDGPITCANPTRTVSSLATACDASTLTYAWSNGNTNASFTTGTPATYTVVVTQTGNGCTASASTTLGINNTNPSVQCTPGADITCTRLTSTISATATASAGNTITSYAWTPGGATTTSITVNNGDTYTVVVTQSNGCTATCNSAVAVDTCKPTVSPSNNGPITCTNRTRTVSANATACTGKTITNYAWTPSGSGASFTTGDAATYCVTVTQSVNGCTATGCTTLAVDTCKPVVTASNNGPITCTNRTRTVSAAATACTGKTITNYAWTPSGSGASFTTGDAATYCVTVTQSGNGCTASDCTTLAVDTCKPTVAPSNDGPITCTNRTRTVAANAAACTGKTITNYAWTPSGSGASFTTGDAATYCVTVTQSGNGCTATGCTTLAVDTCKPTVTASNDGPITCTYPSRTVSAAATACTGKTITSYAWTPSGSGASFSTSDAGTYCVTVTQSGNGCTASDCTTLAVDTLKPSCNIAGPLSATCGSTGNTVTATVTDAQPGITYNWVLVSGNGYAVTGNGTATLTYTAGTGAAVFELTVTNPNGCSSTCSVSVDALCGRFCTYTQGGYGNGNGMRCDGTRTSAFVATLLATPLTIGSTATGNYITFTQADAACLILRMPGGGLATQLNGAATCANPTGIALQNGRFKNVLLGQTIALGLNLRINGGALASLPITGAYFTTFAGSGTGCGSQGTATPGTGRTYSIPQAVLDYLNANTAIYPGGATVGNVFKLASDVLGRVALPGTVPTLSQLTGACGAFNEGFDGCRILGSFSATAPASSRNVTIDQSGSTDQMIALGVSAKAFPNPFATTTTIEFVLADYSSNVAVEVFSLNGEKVATLFAGEVNGGEVKRIEFNGAELANGIYVYRITSSDRTFYDKLILNK